MITSNYTDHQTVQMRVLNEGQCQELYLAALECLEQIGVEVGNVEARELLASAGAEVENTLVRIPPHIVQDAVAAVPRSFTLWGRDATRSIQIRPGKVHFGPGLTSSFFVDPQTGERRRPRCGDPGLTALVSDALPNIDYVMGLTLLGDVTPSLAPVYEFAEMIANTTKPIVAWAYDAEGVGDIYQIALAVAGDAAELRRRPRFALFATYQSPLQHTDEDLGKLLWCAERYVPVVYAGGPTIGMNGPATGAGSLVLGMAMALSGVAIVQLKRRGTRHGCGYHTLCDGPADCTRVSYGSPEMSLYGAAACELAAYLGLPFMGTAGASESKRLDVQTGIDATVQVLMSALSGPSLVHDAGFLDGADIGSLPLLVLTDEVIALARRIVQGFSVSKETIMFDVLREVGPKGLFMAEPRSAKLCRHEIWNPTLMDRSSYPAWEAAGCQDMEDRVMAKLRSIITCHEVPALTPDVRGAIDNILAGAERRLVPGSR